jgi:hypothetical protein
MQNMMAKECLKGAEGGILEQKITRKRRADQMMQSNQQSVWGSDL